MIVRLFKAASKAVREELRDIKKERMYRVYSKLWTSKWNSDLDWIIKQIDLDEETDKNASFKWSQLVQQEIRMWAGVAEPVSMNEINALSERRGFSRVQRQYLIDMTRHMGILADGAIAS